MSGPMSGFGPMAWSPFPYGAPASSGVPSTMFVDLFNAQTVAGAKTFTGKITTAPSAAGSAGFNLAQGIAPTSPVSGDLWMNASNVLLWRAGGSSIQIGGLSVAQTWSAIQTFSNGVTVSSGSLTTSAGRIIRTRVALTTPVTVATSDHVVISNLSVAGAVAVNLPAGVTGQTFIIKDGKGDAAANNITITPAAGTIDGAATLVLSTNYARCTLIYNGTEWNRID